MLNTVTWPEGKQAAVMVTVELDGEFMWLSLDPETAKRPKTLSAGTYGLLRGLDRMLDALEDYNIKATFFVPGIAAERYPEKVKQVAEAGHEIALHGYAHENFGLLAPEQQKKAVEKGIAEIEKVTGKKPVGFRLPEGDMTPETLGILDKAGFLYDNSMLDSDIPYQTIIDGIPADMIEIPMRWEMHDFIYFAFCWGPDYPEGESRVANYKQTLNNWLDELKAYYDYGLCCVMKFDPQIIGTPGRIGLFEQVLEEISSKNIWAATGKEIASYYKNEIMK